MRHYFKWVGVGGALFWLGGVSGLIFCVGGGGVGGDEWG